MRIIEHSIWFNPWKKKGNIKKKKQLEVDNVQIKQQQLEADEILKNAIPLLESAEIAL